MQIRTIIIDDEKYAREELRHLLSKDDSIDLIASCSSPIEALQQINVLRPDLLFLDIKMPILNGFELLSVVNQEIMPHVVFVTAYDEYSLKAFEEKALDYLLKPIEPQRLEKTLIKIKRELSQENSFWSLPAPKKGIKHIPCVLKNSIRFVTLSEIEQITSRPEGVMVITATKEYFTDLTLKELEQCTDFLRCHRQHLVNLDKIAEITLYEGNQAKITTSSGKTLPVSRRYLKRLKEKLHL